jgi:hypothetical protein
VLHLLSRARAACRSPLGSSPGLCAPACLAPAIALPPAPARRRSAQSCHASHSRIRVVLRPTRAPGPSLCPPQPPARATVSAHGPGRTGSLRSRSVWCRSRCVDRAHCAAGLCGAVLHVWLEIEGHGRVGLQPLSVGIRLSLSHPTVGSDGERYRAMEEGYSIPSQSCSQPKAVYACPTAPHHPDP